MIITNEKSYGTTKTASAKGETTSVTSYSMPNFTPNSTGNIN